MKIYLVTLRLNVETDLSAREVEEALREDGWPRFCGLAIQPTGITAYEDVLIQERAA